MLRSNALGNELPPLRGYSNGIEFRGHSNSYPCFIRTNQWLILLLLLLCAPGYAQTEQRPLESLSVSELESLAASHEQTLADDKLSLLERANRLSSQIIIYRRLARHRDALRAGLAYHAIIRRNGRNTDLVKSTLSLAEDLIALDQSAKADTLLSDTLTRIGDLPLDPIVKLSAKTRLAGLAQQAGREEVAAERWRTVGTVAEEALKLIDSRVIGERHRPFCLTSLATSKVAAGETKAAIALLTDWLAKQDVETESFDVEEMHIEVARHYALLEDYSQAAKYLSQSIAIHLRRTSDDPSLAQLHSRLAAVYQSAGDRESSKEQWQAAIGLLKHSLPDDDDPQINVLNAGKWQSLSDAYRLSGAYRQALPIARKLATYHGQTYGEQHAVSAASRSTLGTLLSATGQYREALPLLTEGVEQLRRRKSAEPLRLATALINLGAAEQAFGEYGASREHFEEALKLRREHLSANDPQLAAALNAVASLDVAEGRFAAAIGMYEQALAIYPRERRYDSARSATLLNLAVAYRSQAQYDKAIELCRESLALRKEAEPIELAASYNALAGLYRLRGRQSQSTNGEAAAVADYRQAIDFAKQAIENCNQANSPEHAEAANALNQLAAMAHLLGDAPLAEEYWRRAAEVYRALGRRAMEAQIRNALGVVEYRRENYAAAREQFQQSLELMPHASFRPQLRYSTLCNLASVLDQQGERERAISLLNQAIEIVEAPRAGYLGDERQLAAFFARFGQAFDLLFTWHVEANDLERAFALAERSRNRTLLDRMRLAGVDLRESVPGIEGERLRSREAELRRELNAIRLRASAPASDSAERGAAEQAYLAAQQSYAKVWDEIRNASPVYRQLVAAERQQVSLTMLRGELRAARDLLLMYYVGAQRSYVVAIAGDAPPQSFELQIPDLQGELAAVTPATRQATPADGNRGTPDSAEDELLNDLAQRGLIGTVATEKGERLEAQPPVPGGPLTRGSATLLVDSFRRSLANRFGSGANPAGKLLTEILLPPKLLAIIQQRSPNHVIVIRDGPLNQLPWEALPLNRSGEISFVLDELPPIAYAPSASVLMNLLARKHAGGTDAEASLLTIGNPRYNDRPVAGFATALPRLPGTAAECEQIASRFRSSIDSADVVVLNDATATEHEFLRHVAGRRYIHIAAHGLIDKRHDNLFGAIALTPPAIGDEPATTDGFLEVREIQSLPLSACELAILSACQTNVGAERPLEAGPSLSQAFLLGGARRVVASHWNVSDSSTAELMSVYMEQILDQAGSGRSIDYAEALRAAKQTIRGQSKWQSPYYWSAFVLVGPAGS